MDDKTLLPTAKWGLCLPSGGSASQNDCCIGKCQKAEPCVGLGTEEEEASEVEGTEAEPCAGLGTEEEEASEVESAEAEPRAGVGTEV